MFTKDLVHTLLNRAGNAQEMLAVIDALTVDQVQETVEETVEETPQVQEVKVKSKKAKTKVVSTPESDEIAF
jgi:cell division protein FtsX